MIQAKPQGLFSRDFDLFDETGKKLGAMSYPWSDTLAQTFEATLNLGGDDYRILFPEEVDEYGVPYHRQMELLSRDGKRLATLRPLLSGTTHHNEIRFEGRRLECLKVSTPEYQVREDGKLLGFIRTQGLFSRIREMEFEASLPLPIQCFCFFGSLYGRAKTPR